MKLDLGCGGVRLEGYTPWDWSTGHDVSVLPFEDGSLDEIRASHVLEHIPRDETLGVLTHWVSKLRPGGILRLAVPDADAIFGLAQQANEREEPFNLEGYLLGGGTSPLDHHYTMWNDAKLRAVMGAIGLVEITPWTNSTPVDCSDLPVSLNLAGRKPCEVGTITTPPKYADMRCVMTMPRLCFTDTMFCGVRAMQALGIEMVSSSGVFYGQGMQRILTAACANERLKWAVTLDYDTLFDWQDIVRLRDIAEHYELDAVAPLQAGRERLMPLLVPGLGADGKPRKLTNSDLEQDWFPCASAHFGLTLIRLDSLRRLPKPWFASTPNKDGEWEDGRVDDDIHFWKQARAANWKMGIAPSVTIGHIEMVATWVGKNLQSMYQPIFGYLRDGKPWFVREREGWRHAPTLHARTIDPVKQEPQSGS